MAGRDQTEFSVATLRATEAIASVLGYALKAGDCILLEGPVGAGKTAFARALINSQLEISEHIPSPTFTIVQTYETPRFEIWHCDLYRLSSTAELIELGLEEAISSTVTIIEWPDRLGDLTPKEALRLSISPLEAQEARNIRVSGPERLVSSLVGSAADA